MNLVTVIIPMYNESMNVEKCIKNLCEQSNQNFDVIFVDDGSKDETLKKLKKLLTTDIKFKYKIKSQQNKGAASARKNGINCAKTNFIMMFDCDDILSVNAIEEVYSKFNSDANIDIIIPKMVIQKENGKWEELRIYTEAIKLEPLECVMHSLDGWYIHGCFTAKREIFLKSYEDYSKLNPQDENFINNDEVLTRLNFMNSKNIIQSDSIYFYCFNPVSTTKRINQKKYLTINNTLILKNFFSTFEIFNVKLNAELISVIWGVHHYKKTNKFEILDVFKWNDLIKVALKEINFNKYFFKLSFKRKVQLILLKFIYAV